MARHVKKAQKDLKDHFVDNKMFDSFLSLAAVAGTRAAPKSIGENNKSFGVRLDYANLVKYFEVQPNKGTNDRSLEDMVAKKLHQVLAKASTPIGPVTPEEAIKELFVRFRANAKRRDAEKEANKRTKKGGKKGGKK